VNQVLLRLNNNRLALALYLELIQKKHIGFVIQFIIRSDLHSFTIMDPRIASAVMTKMFVNVNVMA